MLSKQFLFYIYNIHILIICIEVAVLQVGDKAETEDLARSHISEILHSTVQYHLPTKDVQVIYHYPLLDHIKGHPGHQVS